MDFPTVCAFKLLVFLNLAHVSLPESRPRRSPAMLLPTLHTAVVTRTVLPFAQVFIPLGLPAPRGKATLLSLTPQHQAWHHGHL